MFSEFSDSLNQRLRAYLAQQLGYPSGWVGRGLIRLLNRENAGMNQLALMTLGPQADERILEIGFGGGYLIEQILAHESVPRVDGIDYSPDVVAAGQRRFRPAIQQERLALHYGTVDALPFRDAVFDAVVTVNTVYFWTDLTLALTECYRVLKPAGRLILAYNSPEFLEQQQLTQHGFRAYSSENLAAQLKTARFVRVATCSGRDSQNGSFFCSRGERPC